MQEDQGAAAEGAVERRAALRRGAAVLAGVAGLGVVSAVNGSPANAAAGDNLVLGAANDAGAASTSVTSSSTKGTLEVSNSGDAAALRIAIGPTRIPDDSVAGDFFSADGDGTGTVAIPVYTHIGGDSTNPSVSSVVFTDALATQPISVIPTRVLDTRTAAGRSRLVPAPAGTLDSAGRLVGGRAVTLDLSEFVSSFGGVFANVTSTGSTAAGFLQIYPADPRPGASTVNFAAGQTIANFSFTGLDTTDGFTVRIFAAATSHVIVDVTAFAVGSSVFIKEAILPAAARATVAQREAHLDRIRPDWAKRQIKNAGLR